MTPQPIGIMAAMPEEITHLLHLCKKGNSKTTRIGTRDYHELDISGLRVVIVFSGWGKVASACTATTLISQFDVKEILFTGVAGAIAPDLRMGDLIVGSQLIQHDLDPRPLFPRHTIPLLDRTTLPVAEQALNRLTSACTEFLKAGFDQTVTPALAREFRLHLPRVRTGWIASGDQFFSSSQHAIELRSRLPEVLCVEMEGAAVAQVCFELGIPFSIVRIISDHADEGAPHDFPRFLREIASHISCGIVMNWISRRNDPTPRTL